MKRNLRNAVGPALWRSGTTRAGLVGVRRVLLVTVLGLALLVTATPAQAAERQCGAVTAVGLSDPISGGSLTIDGRAFRVAGLDRSVQLPPVSDLRVGVRACVEGDFRVLADGSVDVTNGRVFIDLAGLPNTSTKPPAPMTTLVIASGGFIVALAGVGLIVWPRLVRSRTR